MTRPIVGLCLRHGIKLGELLDAIKRVYVECAEDILKAQAEAISTSRITLMTGVHRTDVAIIREEKFFTPKEHHTASNVISQWRYHPDFCTRPGKPRILESEGKESEFALLVHSVSLSISPYTVLFELERLGMVQKIKDGRVKLLSRAFVPKGDPQSILAMLAEDAEDLYCSVEENAFTASDAEIPHHHLKTEYANIPQESYPIIKQWLMREGSAFHERARNFLSKFDRDINPNSKGTGTYRVALGSFSRWVNVSDKSKSPTTRKDKK